MKPPVKEESGLTGCRRSLRWTSSRLPCCTASGQEPLELRKNERKKEVTDHEHSDICKSFYSYHILDAPLCRNLQCCNYNGACRMLYSLSGLCFHSISLASLLRCFISFKPKNVAVLRGRKQCRLSTSVPLKIAHRAT